MNKSISTEILINATKEKVWTILTDFDNYKLWNPFMIDSSGQAVVGTKLTNTMKNNNNVMKFKPTILTVKQHEYFDWLGSLFFKGLFDGHHFFRIDDLGKGQIKLTQGESFTGILSGIFFRSIGEDTKNNFVKMNNALKQLAEQNSGT